MDTKLYVLYCKLCCTNCSYVARHLIYALDKYIFWDEKILIPDKETDRFPSDWIIP